jgi:hypothetical protein
MEVEMKLRQILTNVLLGICILLMTTGVAFAAHPLVTDDPGSNGKGGFLVELNTAYLITDEVFVFAPVFTYGILDNLDVVLRLETDFNMFADPGLDVKWRFYEGEILSAAVKPSISIPFQQDFDANLYMMFSQKIIQKSEKDTSAASGDFQGFTVHENIGYGISGALHLSMAVCIEPVEKFSIVANVGTEDTFNSLFVIGGIIIGITDNINYDIGVQHDFTGRTGAWSLLNGLSFGF